MSDLRYISVDYQQAYALNDGASALADNAGEASQIRRLRDLRHAYNAAEGQRAEAVRWCETHDERARITSLGIETCWPGDDALEDCAVTDALVILPPKGAA